MSHSPIDSDVQTAGLRKYTPTAVWVSALLAIVLVTFPAVGVAYGLASIPHTDRGCGADSGPICGDHEINLNLSLFGGAVIWALLLLVVLSVVLGNLAARRPLRYWPWLLTVLGYSFAVVGVAFLVFRADRILR
ncbi:hypothetical protein [Psychromicrobium sp. YIM B11713]|uniref:hypothetical protein n=1 Tax=Psychromicrobium sp. YIM B11713 TaxID=3145233 RepID=UPI00374F16B9